MAYPVLVNGMFGAAFFDPPKVIEAVRLIEPGSPETPCCGFLGTTWGIFRPKILDWCTRTASSAVAAAATNFLGDFVGDLSERWCGIRGRMSDEIPQALQSAGIWQTQTTLVLPLSLLKNGHKYGAGELQNMPVSQNTLSAF